MKILIEIPNTLYERYKELGATGQILTVTENAICNGKPLSKEHSDLIDRKELLKAMDTWDKFGYTADGRLVPCDDNLVPYVHYADMVQAVEGMPTIIGTDKAGE